MLSSISFIRMKLCKQTWANSEWSETKLKMADMKKKRQPNSSDLELMGMIIAVSENKTHYLL